MLYMRTHLALKGDEDGEELPLVSDDHAIRDARKFRLECVLKHGKKNKHGSARSICVQSSIISLAPKLISIWIGRRAV